MWFTPRALLLHLTLAVVFPGFMALAWWQLHRALGGNSLSWAYTFEWPFFAGYAVFIWWKLVHDQKHPGSVPAVVSRPAERPVGWALARRRPRRERQVRPTAAQLAALAMAEATGPPGPAGSAADPVPAADPMTAADRAVPVKAGAALPTPDVAGTVDGAAADRAVPGEVTAEAMVPPLAFPSPAFPSLDDPNLSEEDRELAEYNAYLAALSASGRKKRW